MHILTALPSVMAELARAKLLETMGRQRDYYADRQNIEGLSAQAIASTTLALTQLEADIALLTGMTQEQVQNVEEFTDGLTAVAESLGIYPETFGDLVGGILSEMYDHCDGTVYATDEFSLVKLSDTRDFEDAVTVAFALLKNENVAKFRSKINELAGYARATVEFLQDYEDAAIYVFHGQYDSYEGTRWEKVEVNELQGAEHSPPALVESVVY